MLTSPGGPDGTIVDFTCKTFFHLNVSDDDGGDEPVGVVLPPGVVVPHAQVVQRTERSKKIRHELKLGRQQTLIIKISLKVSRGLKMDANECKGVRIAI